jgi:hypothetical protein
VLPKSLPSLVTSAALGAGEARPTSPDSASRRSGRECRHAEGLIRRPLTRSNSGRRYGAAGTAVGITAGTAAGTSPSLLRSTDVLRERARFHEPRGHQEVIGCPFITGFAGRGLGRCSRGTPRPAEGRQAIPEGVFPCRLPLSPLLGRPARTTPEGGREAREAGLPGPPETRVSTRPDRLPPRPLRREAAHGQEISRQIRLVPAASSVVRDVRPPAFSAQTRELLADVDDGRGRSRA